MEISKPLHQGNRRDSLFAQINQTASSYRNHLTLHGLVSAGGSLDPHKIAVRCQDQTLTFQELDQKSNQFAHRLKEAGVEDRSIVGVLIERTIQLPVVLLGVLKAGAAYLPLDPSYPEDRLDFMAEDSGVSLIVAQSDTKHLADPDKYRLLMSDGWESLNGYSTEPPNTGITVEDLAYLIYTSGSTGKPKGVEIRHRNVVNLVEAMAQRPGVVADDTVLAITTISFDISIVEIFLPLSVGATIVIIDRQTAADGVLIAKTLETAGITMMQATPAGWRLLLDSGWDGNTSLKALSGGEALPKNLADRLLSKVGSLWNCYGPTETTVWSTVAQFQTHDEFVSIGTPLANTRIAIVDDTMTALPIGETGELIIAGDGVARSYRGRPELTAERFQTLSIEDGASEIYYRTGDLARITSEGVIQCLGRIDNQVKIRGHRIEPEEIESVLEKHDQIQAAVVIPREDKLGNQQLVAFLVTQDESPNEAQIRSLVRSDLADRLPVYMVPSIFVFVDEFPLTGSGKVDRKALPDHTTAQEDGVVETSNSTEKVIAEVWGQNLDAGQFTVTDDFFALGGTSLLLHQVRMDLQERLDVEIAMVELFAHSNIHDLARHLDNRQEDVTEDLGVYQKGNHHPLITMARRFLIPGMFVTLYLQLKHKAKVSPKAEVELSPNLRLGRGITIGSFTKVKSDKGLLEIGARSSFANGCFIGSGPKGLRIGENFVCGPNVAIVPSNYVFDKKDVALADQGHTSKGITIGDNVWVGAGAVILDGAVLGNNTIVTAGSVVEGKFDGDCVLRGNPAEIIARR